MNRNRLAAWIAARRLVLSSIVLAGCLATMSSLTARSHAPAPVPVQLGQVDHQVITYSGIGVELSRVGCHYVVEQVFPGSPADGLIYPGAILVSVDGVQPRNMREWASRIQGAPGTALELELAYHGRGHQRVNLRRALISIER